MPALKRAPTAPDYLKCQENASRIWLLYAEHHWTIEEIAEHFQLAESTVRLRISKGEQMAMVTASDSKAFSEVFERRAIGILSQTFDSVEHVHRLILRAPSLESLERVNLPGITALLGQLTNTIAICSRIRADGRRLALQEQRDSAPLQGIVNGVYPVGPQSAGD